MEGGEPGGITRRQALKRGVVSGVWVVPVLQVVSMNTADAASAPPQRGRSEFGQSQGGGSARSWEVRRN